MLSLAHSRIIWKTAFLPLLDFLNLLLSCGILYFLRYELLSEWFEGQKLVYGAQYLAASLVVCGVVVFLFSTLGLYRILNRHSITSTILNINLAIWFTVLSVITYLYFNEYTRRNFAEGGFSISRFILGTIGFVAVALVLTGRAIFYWIEQIFYQFNWGKTEIILIGEQSGVILRDLFGRRDVAKVHTFAELNMDNFGVVTRLIENHQVSEVYLNTLKNFDFESELALLCERYKIRFVFTPQGYGILQAFRVRPILIRGEYLFEMYYSNLEGWQVVIKRLFDIVIAAAFLMVFGWLYVLIAIMIKLDSKGTIFYASERVGADGKIFKMYKFRRFKQEYCTSESDPKAKSALEFEKELIRQQGQKANRGALYKIKDDPRMTRVGRILEKTSLDELPQFFNVLNGTLSLVGPRAHQPREVKKYAKHQYKVLNIKPGITGYAQVKGRSDLPFEKEAELDTWYVEHWNFMLDLWILLKTPFVIFFKKHQS